MSKKRDIAATRNTLINTRSSPSTPDELLRGSKPTRRPFPFGTCCMVTQHADKRHSLARTHHTAANAEPKAELGVCMGPDLITGRTLFLLANGSIVPRRPTTPFPPYFIPFDWTAKQFVLRTSLPDPIQSTPPVSHTNTVLQLPGTPHAEAIASVTSHIPSPLPADLIYSLQSPTSLAPSLTAHPVPSATPPPELPPTTPTHHQHILEVTQPHHTLPEAPPPLPSHSTLTATASTVSAQLPVPAQPPSLPPPPPPPPLPTTTAPLPHLPTTAALPQHTDPPTRRSSRISHPPNFWRGCYTHSPLPAPANAAQRKIFNARLAAIRNRQHRLDTLPDTPLNNRPTTLEPQPLPTHRPEMSIRKASFLLPTPDIAAGITKELGKHFNTYESLKLIPRSSVEPTAIFLRSQMLIKKKSNGTITARLAIDGSRQPRESYNDTYAGTSDTTNRAFILSAYLADASQRQCLNRLLLGDFDFPGAFLHNKLTRDMTNGHQLIATLPSDLPSPLAGKLAEITGCCYGIKQANHEFDKDLVNILTKAGFLPTPSDHHSFHKRCPINTADSLTLNMHVDDGWYVTCSPTLRDELKSILQQRYGPIAFNDESTGVCGVRLTRHSNHSCTLDQGPHILKFLHQSGMDLVPPALTPSTSNFFDPPSDLTPVDRTRFMRINGTLVFLLPIRHDIRKEVIHLCTRNSAPTQSDLSKQVHLLRYLKSCPNLGPTFSTNPSAFKTGVTLRAAADSSHACHPDGHSHSAYTIQIGTVNAPFVVHSSAETAGIALSPCEAEYLALGRCAKDVVFFRQFASDIGFPQPLPTIILEDNQPAINLTTANQVTRKSRHIALKSHYVRWLYLTKQIVPQHISTHDMIADGLTKSLSPSKFLWFRSQLLNTPAIPH